MSRRLRRVRYQVAMSLDGFIAGPDGSADWIVADPDIDFSELFAQFDTFLMGRHTYEWLVNASAPPMPGQVLVFSKTLRQEDHPAVRIVGSGETAVINDLRNQAGKDIWLFGGGQLFRSLVEKGLVDTVEVAVIPILLGAGLPLLPPPAPRTSLQLTRHHVYPKSGIVSLEYDIRY
jgi:dihydrofolate reductase